MEMNQTCLLKPFGSAFKSLCCAVLLCVLVAAAERPTYAVGGTFFDGLDSYDASRWFESDGWT
jgi:hypothetical protein